jgi:hypothetical protein
LGPLKFPIGALRGPWGAPSCSIGKGQGRQKKVLCRKGRKEENEINDHSKIVEPLRASSGPPGGHIRAPRGPHQGLKKAPSGP